MTMTMRQFIDLLDSRLEVERQKETPDLIKVQEIMDTIDNAIEQLVNIKTSRTTVTYNWNKTQHGS